MATPIFDKFLGDMSGLSQRICSSNLKSVSLAILEQLAFNAQKFTGVTWPWPRPYLKNFKGHVWTVSKNMPANFEVCSFNRLGIISTYFPKKLGVTLSWPRPLFEIFLRCHVQTVSGNMPAKFDVRSFECIGSIDSGNQLHYKIDGPRFAEPSIAAVSP